MIGTSEARPRFAVVGLDGGMARAVRDRCDDVAELVFIAGDRARNDYPPGVDFIVFTRACPHRASRAARSHPWTFCRGGVATVVRIVRTYAAGLATPAGRACFA